MNTCDAHGDSIVVYAGRRCPACEQVAELEHERDGLQEKLDRAESDADRLMARVDELEAEQKTN